jgi:hypothetical protein
MSGTTARVRLQTVEYPGEIISIEELVGLRAQHWLSISNMWRRCETGLTLRN